MLVQLRDAEPRAVGPSSAHPLIIVFIDGACEDSGVSIGGVAFLPSGVEYFGAMVPEVVVESWKRSALQRQTIGQAELFPAAVARWTWASKLAGRRVIFLIDNEAARLALVFFACKNLQTSSVAMSSNSHHA